MVTKTYDPAAVVLNYGAHTVSGYGEGTKIKVEFESDDWSVKSGVDGDPSRSLSNDRRAKVTIKLKQGADSNAVLSAFAVTDRTTKGGMKPLLILDGNGTSKHAAEQAMIKRVADVEYGKEDTDIEWVFLTGFMDHYVGNQN